MLLLSVSNIFFNLRNFFLDVLSLNILFRGLLFDLLNPILEFNLFSPESLGVVHQESLLKLSDIPLVNLDTGVSLLYVLLMLSIKLIQVFNFSFEMLFSLNLLSREMLFV